MDQMNENVIRTLNGTWDHQMWVPHGSKNARLAPCRHHGNDVFGGLGFSGASRFAGFSDLISFEPLKPIVIQEELDIFKAMPEENSSQLFS